MERHGWVSARAAASSQFSRLTVQKHLHPSVSMPWREVGDFPVCSKMQQCLPSLLPSRALQGSRTGATVHTGTTHEAAVTPGASPQHPRDAQGPIPWTAQCPRQCWPRVSAGTGPACGCPWRWRTAAPRAALCPPLAPPPAAAAPRAPAWLSPGHKERKHLWCLRISAFMFFKSCTVLVYNSKLQIQC